MTVFAALLPTDHFLIMTTYALLVSIFFAFLWRNEGRDRWVLRQDLRGGRSGGYGL